MCHADANTVGLRYWHQWSSLEKGAQTMREHITETSTAPLACPHCGCSDLLYGIGLGEVLAATICRSEDATSPDEQHDRPLWNTARWPERAAIVRRSCAAVEL